jgi:hypothetical protein
MFVTITEHIALDRNQRIVRIEDKEINGTVNELKIPIL